MRAHLGALDATEGRSGRATLRKEQGSHYTPRALVDWVLDRAMRADDRVPACVIDPACGAGNFLCAVVERLVARGVPAAEALALRIYGIDIDADAVRLCRAQLIELMPIDADAATRARVEAALEAHVVVGDALERSIDDITGVRGFDLIVGNPPFLNQLEVATAASRARAGRLRARTDGVVGGYADLSAAFLIEACRHVAPGGVVGFVMPQWFLAAADLRAARAWVAANTRVHALWTADERLFEDASVRVAALVVEPGVGFHPDPRLSRTIERAFGAAFAPATPIDGARLAGDGPWAALFADVRGVPEIASIAAGDGATIGAIAAATADFRDQFYGLRGAIVDRADADGGLFPKLVSTRHVDLARCRWGAVRVKILFEKYDAPRADRAALEADDAMRAWMHARLVPKILVATQTKAMEAVVDERGEWLPVVPILTATLREGAGRDPDIDLWMLAAAVASPVVTAEAARISYGAALSSTAIKLSAKQLLAMPLPRDRRAWQESARRFREASAARDDAERVQTLRAFAEASCSAYRLDAGAARAVLAFWSARALDPFAAAE